MRLVARPRVNPTTDNGQRVMAVVLLGTLDTKGTELQFVRDLLRAAGLTTQVLDAGVLGAPTCEADIPRDSVYRAAGRSLEAVRRAGDRGKAVEAAARGAAALVAEMHALGQVEG